MKRITKTIAVCMLIPTLMLGGLPVSQTASLAKSGKKAGAPVKLKKKSGTLTVLQDADRFTCGTTRIRVKKARGVKIKKISYKVENDHIARVSTKGKVTALTGGNTKVLVNVKFKKKGKIKTKKLTYRLKVKKEFKNILSGLTVKYRNYATYVGGGEGIMPLYKTTTKMPEGFYVWECLDMTFEDPSIAEEGKAGFVLGKKAGSTKVTIKAKDGSGLSVTVLLKVVASEGELLHNDDLFTSETIEYLMAVRSGWTEEEQHFYMDKEGNLAYSVDWEKQYVRDTNIKALCDEYNKSEKLPDNTPQDAVASLISTADSMIKNESEEKAFISTLQEKIVKPVLSAQSIDQLLDCSINFTKQGLDGFVSLSGFRDEFNNYAEFSDYFNSIEQAPDEAIPVLEMYNAKLSCPEGIFWGRMIDKTFQKKAKKYFKLYFSQLGAGELSDKALDDFMQIMTAVSETYYEAYDVKHLASPQQVEYMTLNRDFRALKLKQHLTEKGYKLTYNDVLSVFDRECIFTIANYMTDEYLDALKLILIQSATDKLTYYSRSYWNDWNTCFPEDQDQSTEEILEDIYDNIYQLIPYDMDQLYTKKYLPTDAKKKFQKTIDEYISSYRDLIRNSSYTQTTKDNLLKRFDNMHIEVLYPTEDEYKKLQIPYDLRTAAEGANLAENILKAFQYRADLEVMTVGTNADTTPWWAPSSECFDFGLPGDDNAFFTVWRNRACFMYGGLGDDILYHFSGTDDPTVDAFNIAMTSTTIGHEIGHAFDKKGINFNEKGQIQNIWGSTADRERFLNKLDRLCEIYNTVYMFLDMNTKTAYYKNPGVVTTEASSDLSGSEVGLNVIKTKYPGRDDLIKLYFECQARQWMAFNNLSDLTDDELRADESEQHPYNRQRANITVSMMDEYYRIFDVKETDAMYIAPEDRVTLWD